MTWEELYQKYDTAISINIYPTMEWMEENYIFDEDKSVRWNNEQRQRSNSKYREILNKNCEARTEAIAAVMEEIYGKIIEEVNYPIDRVRAKMIWIKASDECEACGCSDTEASFDFLKDMIQFVNDIVGTHELDDERLVN